MNRLPVNYNPDATKPERWLQFMDELFNPEDIGYIQFEKGKKISSTDFYKINVSWCEANLEKTRASASFLHYKKENQKKYGIIYDVKLQ